MDDNINTRGHYLENNPSWHIEDSPWKARQILRMLKKNKISPGTVCEIGCSVGEKVDKEYNSIVHYTNLMNVYKNALSG